MGKRRLTLILKTAGSRVHHGLTYFGAFLVFCLFAVVFGQVIARGLKSATPWAEEAAQFILISVVFLGAAAVQEEDGHVRVDFLLNRLPERARKAVRILLGALLIGALTALLIGVWLLAPFVSRLTTPGGGIPLWWMYLIVGIGLVWWLILAVRSLWLLIWVGKVSGGSES